MKPGDTAYWIDQRSYVEDVASAKVVEVREPARPTGARCYRIDPPRDHRPVVNAKDVFPTPAAAWRALAAERRAEARNLMEVADQCEAKAVGAER